jgi:hypothetical protein
MVKTHLTVTSSTCARSVTCVQGSLSASAAGYPRTHKRSLFAMADIDGGVWPMSPKDWSG